MLEERKGRDCKKEGKYEGQEEKGKIVVGNGKIGKGEKKENIEKK